MKIKNKIAAAALALGLFAPGLALAACGQFVSPVSNVATTILFQINGPLIEENSFKIYVVDTNGNAWEQETLWGGQQKLFSTFVGQIWYVTNPIPSDNNAKTPDEFCYHAYSADSTQQNNVIIDQ